MRSIIAATALVATSMPAPIGILENPPGRVATHHLVIISAYSCPYCRILDQQGLPEIRSKWEQRGVALETVPFVLHATDIAATIAAMCGAPSGYARRSTILFRAQPDIQGNWSSADRIERSKVESLTSAAGAPAIARLSGIDMLGPALGLSRNQLRECLADPSRQRAVVARQKAADVRWRIRSTPTAILDGKVLPPGWPSLRSQLEAVAR